MLRFHPANLDWPKQPSSIYRDVHTLFSCAFLSILGCDSAASGSTPMIPIEDVPEMSYQWTIMIKIKLSSRNITQLLNVPLDLMEEELIYSMYDHVHRIQVTLCHFPKINSSRNGTGRCSASLKTHALFDPHFLRNQ